MNASAPFAPLTAERRFSTSTRSGSRFLTAIGPTQRGRRYLAVAPLSASFLSSRGKSSRSWPGSRGVSPSNPLRRSAT